MATNLIELLRDSLDYSYIDVIQRDATMQYQKQPWALVSISKYSTDDLLLIENVYDEIAKAENFGQNSPGWINCLPRWTYSATGTSSS